MTAAEPCAYPQHRQSGKDWRLSEADPLVCGICHPRQPEFDARTRAWVEADPSRRPPVVVPQETKAAMADIRAEARASGPEEPEGLFAFADVQEEAPSAPSKRIPSSLKPALNTTAQQHEAYGTGAAKAYAREQAAERNEQRRGQLGPSGVAKPASRLTAYGVSMPDGAATETHGRTVNRDADGRKQAKSGPSEGLFDADDHLPSRHAYLPDANGRCTVCGLITDGSDKVHTPGLADKFLVPTFSVLDTRQDYWQKRRRAWLALGIRGECGRDTGLLGDSGVFNRPGIYDGIAEVEATTGERVGVTKYRAEYSGLQNLAAQKRGSGRGYEQWEANLEANAGESGSMQTGTSVFDPVLCEIAYRWFSGPGARVLDPFAGGVVRGLVAGALGRQYIGIELRPEQIADNREQAGRLLGPGGDIDWGGAAAMPQWIEHDATRIGELGIAPVDMILTCPPYADLEVYSKNPQDLSTMEYPTFRIALGAVMAQSAAVLKQHRFAVWVVGEARDKKGTAEYGLVADTVKAAHAAGLELYNSAILVNSVGSGALRAQNTMKTRKLVRVHQHVLIFLKGDHKKAAAACGSAEVI